MQANIFLSMVSLFILNDISPITSKTAHPNFEQVSLYVCAICHEVEQSILTMWGFLKLYFTYVNQKYASKTYFINDLLVVSFQYEGYRQLLFL